MSEERKKLIELEKKLNETVPYPIWSRFALMFYKMMIQDYRYEEGIYPKVNSGIVGFHFSKNKRISEIEYNLCFSSLSLFLQTIEFLKSKNITPKYDVTTKSEYGKIHDVLQLNLGDYGEIYVRPDDEFISLRVANDPEKVKFVDEIRNYLKSTLRTR